MKENLLVEKSLLFGQKVVETYSALTKKNEFVISKQFLRSGTSIGANINEANYAQSKADFVSKMHIALKETAETEYWINLLGVSEYIDTQTKQDLLERCLQLKRLLIATINTSKAKMS